MDEGGFVAARKAAEARNDTIAADHAGILPTNGKQTVEDWLTAWLDGKTGSESIRSTTAFAYRMHVYKYLIPYLGHIRLIDRRPRHVTDMLIAIRDEHEKRRTEALKANAIFRRRSRRAQQGRTAKEAEPSQDQGQAHPGTETIRSGDG